ncbi:MAG TPA: DUF4760 domain-containing protein [Cyclobacteriaceae bacterium]|jgi:hypothetical protein|nr:DUF4760 domain-containing protein [Cyclobacteriaceae bacterium]
MSNQKQLTNAEKVTKFLVENIFKGRFIFLIIGVIGIYFIVKYVSEDQSVSRKDLVQVITGCALIIALFYTIITYEYNQRKFQYDVKNSRDILSFNISKEWHDPTLVGYSKTCHEFMRQCHKILKEVDANKLHEALEAPENGDQKMALLSIFNYFESISLGIKQGIMDEDFIKGFFKSVFTHYYNEYNFYILHRRVVKKNQRLWQNFTSLAQKWIEE